MSEQYRQSTLNLYDSANKTELFQVKSLESKATITSSKEIAFHNEKMSIKNYSPEGEVIDSIPDVVGAFRDNENAIASEAVLREEAVAEEKSQRESAIASEAVLRTEAVQAEQDARVLAVEAETSARNTAISNEASNRASEISETKSELEAKVNAEKARIDTILAGSSVDLDQFKEIADYASSLNTERMDQITAVSNNLATHDAEFEKLKAIVIALAPDSASHFAWLSIGNLIALFTSLFSQYTNLNIERTWKTNDINKYYIHYSYDNNGATEGKTVEFNTNTNIEIQVADDSGDAIHLQHGTPIPPVDYYSIEEMFVNEDDNNAKFHRFFYDFTNAMYDEFPNSVRVWLDRVWQTGVSNEFYIMFDYKLYEHIEYNIPYTHQNNHYKDRRRWVGIVIYDQNTRTFDLSNITTASDYEYNPSTTFGSYTTPLVEYTNTTPFFYSSYGY